MIIECKKPVLIVEGAGDVKAVPRLIRETLQRHGIFDLNPAARPKSNMEIRKLLRVGELERYVEYAVRDDGDSVLLVLDCDDFVQSKFAEYLDQEFQIYILRRKSELRFFDLSLRRCFCIALTKLSSTSETTAGCLVARHWLEM